MFNEDAEPLCFRKYHHGPPQQHGYTLLPCSPKKKEMVILTYSEQSHEASKTKFFRVWFASEPKTSISLCIFGAPLSMVWLPETTFTETKTPSARFYSQEEHRSGGTRIVSLAARFICTPCTSPLLLTQEWERAKLSKTQVPSYLKGLDQAQT